MNIQIFGRPKCFDTKKAERYFKERRIKFQLIDVRKYGISKGEFRSVARAVGGWDKLLDEKTDDLELLALIRHLVPEDREDKILENPRIIKTPIVRNGKQACIGYQPEIWKSWD